MVTKPKEVREYAQAMLGQELVTKNAPHGIICNKVLLVERLFMRRALYLSIIMDRLSQGPLMVASPFGGSSIVNFAQRNPEVIFTQPIDIMDGLQEEECYRMATNIGLDEGSVAHQNAMDTMMNLYQMFLARDCTQIEINPLMETPEGDIVVCDVKINFDDNAAFRQPEIFSYRDRTQEDHREAMAFDNHLNYVGLDGSIACMVNGAGLAMSTMDLILLKGGSPANFLDVGGGANEKQVEKAFDILNSDPKVKVILINIFGGLMRCDVIAAGILNAAKTVGIQKPVVLRLQGTNEAVAKILIESSGFRMIMADSLEEAATKAIGISTIASQAENIQVGVKFEGFNDF